MKRFNQLITAVLCILALSTFANTSSSYKSNFNEASFLDSNELRQEGDDVQSEEENVETDQSEVLVDSLTSGSTEVSDTAAGEIGSEETLEETPIEEVEEESLSFHQVLKDRFIEGGAGFMGIVLLCLILGLAIAIERIIYLNMSSINTDVFIEEVEEAIKSGGGIESAKELCRNTRGPVASIYYQGLDRASEGVDAAEKAVISYGGVQMGQLEKNVSWVSLFIAIAPMLGFMGTVIGMIQAFDKISLMGGLEATAIASDIKVALLTTVFGLIVAIILQIFYNYIIAKTDSIVNSMEDASITLVDMLVEENKR